MSSDGKEHVERIKREHEEEPALKEIEIDYRFMPAKRGVKKLCLTISFDALFCVLEQCQAVLALEDVPNLLYGLVPYADAADVSDEKALAEWKQISAAMIAEEEERTGGGDETHDQ